MNQQKITCGEFLVQQLEAYGIDTIFGIPGVHTIELYRGLENSSMRHITPRHEQGAGFMADGYARVTGKPAACFIITGPGMTNILTAMGQAYADSIPMLVISSVNEVKTLGMRQGRLHELYSQRDVVAGVAAWSHTILSPSELPEVLAKAFALFQSDRPRPVHIEIPTDVITQLVDLPLQRPMEIYRPQVASAAIERVYQRLESAKKPFLLLGGGAAEVDPASLVAITEQFDMPILNTVNAKGVYPPAHPLALGSYQTYDRVREAVVDADLVLAIGTELGETDYDVAFNGEFRLNGEIIRVDIDPEQLQSNYLSSIGIVSDACSFIEALAARIEASDQPKRYIANESAGAKLAASLKSSIADLEPKEWDLHRQLFETIEQSAPDVIFAGDSTQLVYSGNFFHQPTEPRHWFNSATGYGTLGYGLPAAMGAKLAKPHSTVVSIIGDGGIQFSLTELATAVEEEIGIVVLLWNNFGYQEIKRSMINEGIAPIGVDIYTPNFMEIVKGYGCDAVELRHLEQLPKILAGGEQRKTPLIILADEASLYENHL